MAEGDSIARLAARLHERSAGAPIVRSDVRHPRFALVDLAGQTITGWHPRGKHLLMRTDAGVTVHSHLRMSGRWSVLGAGKRLPRTVAADLRIALHLGDGRTLAGIGLPVLAVLATRDEHRVVGHLGPDLLGETFDASAAAARLQASAERAVLPALLDQRCVAGLGNMWAQELLFLGHVNPWRPVGEVDPLPLLDRARTLLRNAVTSNPGQNTTGRARPPHWVYGRKGRPCLRCTTSVAFAPPERTPHGRETWWCPRCQPAGAHRAGPERAT
ncbi:endonuclease-8 [Pseudonocardia sediminis]|uniref:DNA-(apurinic or apyrimidinic site) lyase n=1 Tax=Pseudonocardia sediminis TaxID=1397368 RepID=A0A4Q7UTS3_PSEST|nr:DNA-formamidopyrimidine glycosylase family protein [Pseudonocardia sediminis]RZT85232.1 endonuclease-8 [Pseudonocardia sediminis]